MRTTAQAIRFGLAMGALVIALACVFAVVFALVDGHTGWAGAFAVATVVLLITGEFLGGRL
jgi:hypothetical protein